MFSNCVYGFVSKVKAGLNSICMTQLLRVMLSIGCALCVKTARIGVFVSVYPLLLPCDPVVRGCWVDAVSQSSPRVHMCVYVCVCIQLRWRHPWACFLQYTGSVSLRIERRTKRRIVPYCRTHAWGFLCSVICNKLGAKERVVGLQTSE